jgi:hypothetical protein
MGLSREVFQEQVQAMQDMTSYNGIYRGEVLAMDTSESVKLGRMIVA